MSGAFGADAFQEFPCRFVVGILGDDFAFEGALEDRLTEAFGTLEGEGVRTSIYSRYREQ